MPNIFDDLLYGPLVYLVLLLYLILIFALQYKWKETGALTIPLSIIIGLQYLEEDLGYPALIMFGCGIMLILTLTKQMKG